ncbi:MAG TPA: hypothetical protein VNF06_01740 [Candidatus Aquilonibacter sp.]|nr:hypothetical protein [Candidatus Aquilonibacter sp.]
MEKANIGMGLAVVGLILILYSAYWLYSGYNLQANLASFCISLGSTNQTTYLFECSYGAITIQGSAPTQLIPFQLLPFTISSITMPYEWLFGLGMVIFAVGLFLKLKKLSES